MAKNRQAGAGAIKLHNARVMVRHSTGRAMGLLALNYQDGDEDLVETFIAGERSDDVLHGITGSLIDFPETQRSPSIARHLITLYYRNPCSACRGSAIKLLIQTFERAGIDTLADRLRDEVTGNNAVVVPPSLIGAWVRKSAA